MKHRTIVAASLVMLFAGTGMAQAASTSRYSCYPTDRGCCSKGDNYDNGSYNRYNKFCQTTTTHPSNGHGGNSTQSADESSNESRPAPRQQTATAPAVQTALAQNQVAAQPTAPAPGQQAPLPVNAPGQTGTAGTASGGTNVWDPATRHCKTPAGQIAPDTSCAHEASKPGALSQSQRAGHLTPIVERSNPLPMNA